MAILSSGVRRDTTGVTGWVIYEGSAEFAIERMNLSTGIRNESPRGDIFIA